jgi:hypothetical protein
MSAKLPPTALAASHDAMADAISLGNRSPDRRSHVHWGSGTTRILTSPPLRGMDEMPPPHERPQGAPPRPGQSTTARSSFDALSILQRLTSYVALKDPEKLAVAASMVGLDSLPALFQSNMGEQSGTPRPRQHHRTWKTTRRRRCTGRRWSSLNSSRRWRRQDIKSRMSI